jgi:hypothetical protein
VLTRLFLLLALSTGFSSLGVLVSHLRAARIERAFFKFAGASRSSTDSLTSGVARTASKLPVARRVQRKTASEERISGERGGSGLVLGRSKVLQDVNRLTLPLLYPYLRMQSRAEFRLSWAESATVVRQGSTTCRCCSYLDCFRYLEDGPSLTCFAHLSMSGMRKTTF